MGKELDGSIREGEEHGRQKLSGPFFSPRRMRDFRYGIEEFVEKSGRPEENVVDIVTRFHWTNNNKRALARVLTLSLRETDIFLGICAVLKAEKETRLHVEESVSEESTLD